MGDTADRVEAGDDVRGPGPDVRSVAAEAWRRIFDFVVRTSAARNRALSSFGLTPNDSRALAALDAETGRTMRSLADEWRCDASTATWIVDRLEQRSLAERRSLPEDRRVRLVVLTPLGAATRARLDAAMYAPPPELLDVPLERLAALRDAAAVLDQADPQPTQPDPLTPRPDPDHAAPPRTAPRRRTARS